MPQIGQSNNSGLVDALSTLARDPGAAASALAAVGGRPDPVDAGSPLLQRHGDGGQPRVGAGSEADRGSSDTVVRLPVRDVQGRADIALGVGEGATVGQCGFDGGAARGASQDSGRGSTVSCGLRTC